MARMPGAIWKPLAANWNKQPRMKAYDFFCLHTMVGGLDGTDGFFRNANGVGYGGTESHFGVGPDGTIYQWQDTDFQADANGNGNWHVISSENADTGVPFPKWGGSDVPAMTAQQVEANAQIAVWLYRTHGIPLDLTPDSKPGRRGLAVHRWGVPGYMVAGAEQWSTSQGKACPGDRRIAQAPQISDRAKQILNGDDDMFTDDDRKALDWVVDAVSGAKFRHDERTSLLALNQRHYAETAGTLVANVEAMKAGGQDPKALAAAIRSELGDDFARQVLAELGDLASAAADDKPA